MLISENAAKVFALSEIENVVGLIKEMPQSTLEQLANFMVKNEPVLASKLEFLFYSAAMDNEFADIDVTA